MKTIDLMIKTTISFGTERSSEVKKMTFVLSEIQCFSYDKIYLKGNPRPFLIDSISNSKLNQMKAEIEDEEND